MKYINDQRKYIQCPNKISYFILVEIMFKIYGSAFENEINKHT